MWFSQQQSKIPMPDDCCVFNFVKRTLDGKHLTCFQSETSIFNCKLLRRIADGTWKSIGTKYFSLGKEYEKPFDMKLSRVSTHRWAAHQRMFHISIITAVATVAVFYHGCCFGLSLSFSFVTLWECLSFQETFVTRKEGKWNFFFFFLVNIANPQLSSYMPWEVLRIVYFM